MLSILIPTYNYDVTALVNSLHNQLKAAQVVFEIIIFDDGSFDKANSNNKLLNTLPNVSFSVNEYNIGSSNNRNNLIEASKYDYVLFLDSDMLIINKNFIFNYLKQIEQKKQVVYGGIKYSKSKPKNSYLLRWYYGIKNESNDVDLRNKNKYRSMLCSNVLIHKDVFKFVKFDTTLNTYGYEDTLFCFNLKKNKIPVSHIDNVVLHNDNTTNIHFIDKTKSAIKNLDYITKTNLIDFNFIKLSNVYKRIKLYKINYLLAVIYQVFGKIIESNLKSEKPSLKLFNLYKLSYFCFLNLKK